MTAGTVSDLVPFWIDTASEDEAFVFFRGRFTVERPARVRIESSASGPYTAWLDGEPVLDGPIRAHVRCSYLADVTTEIAAGTTHVLSLQCHHEAIDTRLMHKSRPHVFVRASIVPNIGGVTTPIVIAWRGLLVSAYRTGVRRINPELGWIDWCDTRELPVDWHASDFNDDTWHAVRDVDLGAWNALPAPIGPVASVPVRARLVDEGYLDQRFGYELDDPPVRFHLRRLAHEREAVDAARGVWRRFDLDGVKLVRPVLEIDAPRGTIVETAYAESLTDGRVSPFISLSGGQSCNMDHFVAAGGRQRIDVSAHRGARFIEVHLLPPDGRPVGEPATYFPDTASMTCLWRTMFPSGIGAFQCGDDLLNRIWSVGIDTLAACTEDALDDCPTRERGQWLGDVAAIGEQIAATSFDDMRVFRRGLVDAASHARSDGMVAGLCPGTILHMPSYAASWVDAVIAHVNLTGDASILDELFDAMVRNVDALCAYLRPDGIAESADDGLPLGWVFVDWGYTSNDGPSDMMLNMHLLSAVRAALIWCDLVPDKARCSDVTERFTRVEHRLAMSARRFVETCLAETLDWRRLGYHRAVFALRLGLVPEPDRSRVLDAIGEHHARGFPNDRAAPRNHSPAARDVSLITPYFMHYALPLFAEAGRFSDVLDIYRSCWGWLLDEDHRTWCEVFDRGWSHCHQWSGTPTAQLHRYVLGLTPFFSRGYGTYRFTGVSSRLSASGRLPFPGTGEALELSTRSCHDRFDMDIDTPRPISIVYEDAHTPIVLSGRNARTQSDRNEIRVAAGRSSLRFALNGDGVRRG